MMFTNGDSVTILRSGGRNRFGDTEYEESHQIHNVGIHYSDGRKVKSNDDESEAEFRDTFVTDITLFCPTGSNIEVTDKVELPDGSICRVTRKPFPFKSPISGWAPGMTVMLRLIEG
ncbi:hypothetical protein PXH69_24180 [Rhodococcus qingshengii]|uniref:Phage tail protein n=1 Tax=Rhodococcus qingshengii TaxID=334542 RepID=A0AAW6LS50_RHOSG|nr:hypothetical protein [Rhodococcus qingshengii]MDE8648081.1 hypothetical protein [Rhodococcus qingshengii]